MPVTPFEFVVVALAAYRVTRFLLWDSLMGMGVVGGEFVSKLGERIDRFAYDAAGNDRSWWRGKVGDLLTCPFCLGFWVSGGCYVALLAGSGREWSGAPVVLHGLVVFAVAAVQSWLCVLDARLHSGG